MMQQLEVDMLRRLSFLQYMTDAELDGLREIAQLYTFEPGGIPVVMKAMLSNTATF